MVTVFTAVVCDGSRVMDATDDVMEENRTNESFARLAGRPEFETSKFFACKANDRDRKGR